MAYTAKADGAWVDKLAVGGTATTNLIDAGDANRWEANQSDANTRLTALEVGAVATSTQTASYTLVLADAGKAVEMNSASATTVTVPPNSSVAFPVGTVLEVLRLGAGTVTLVAGAGVTLRTPTGTLLLRAQYSSAGLRQRSANEWVVSGDLS